MTRITIPYRENHQKSILNALSIIREYSDMKFEEIGILGKEFLSMKDVYYDVPTEKLAIILDSLSSHGFVYRLIEG